MRESRKRGYIRARRYIYNQIYNQMHLSFTFLNSVKKVLDLARQRISQLPSVMGRDVIGPMAEGIAQQIRITVSVNEHNKLAKKKGPLPKAVTPPNSSTASSFTAEPGPSGDPHLAPVPSSTLVQKSAPPAARSASPPAFVPPAASAPVAASAPLAGPYRACPKISQVFNNVTHLDEQNDDDAHQLCDGGAPIPGTHDADLLGRHAILF